MGARSDVAELVAEAGRAVGEQLLPSGPAVPSGRWRELDVEAAGRESVLRRWLNELLYRAEAEWWIPVEFAGVCARHEDLGASPRPRLRRCGCAKCPEDSKQQSCSRRDCGPAPPPMHGFGLWLLR